MRTYGLAEADSGALAGKSIAVLGFGSQGHAHALNLRDSALQVIVGQRSGSARYAAACAAGFEVVSIADAARRADLLIFALPDDAAPEIYESEIAPHLRRGQALGFIHGFCIHFERIIPPNFVDVLLVAPKAQGLGVRRLFAAGHGAPALVAVHQDASGVALATALAWATGIGAARAAIFETTFREETETDLFGEQAVLCGGLSALIASAFEVLVEAGYPPALAYFECCHEVKLLADLIHDGGITGMRERISTTAAFGDVTRGPRVIGEASRAEMRAMLEEIRSGHFAAEVQRDFANGRRSLLERIAEGRESELERVGREIRARIRDPRGTNSV